MTAPPVRSARTTIIVALLFTTFVLYGRRATLSGSPSAHAQQRGANPPAQPAPPAQAGPRGGGRGRGGVQVMTLVSSAWPDGGQIPAKYTQAGEDVSPALTWSGAPEGVVSYVLVVHDVDEVAERDVRVHEVQPPPRRRGGLERRRSAPLRDP